MCILSSSSFKRRSCVGAMNSLNSFCHISSDLVVPCRRKLQYICGFLVFAQFKPSAAKTIYNFARILRKYIFHILVKFIPPMRKTIVGKHFDWREPFSSFLVAAKWLPMPSPVIAIFTNQPSFSIFATLSQAIFLLSFDISHRLNG